MGSPGTRALTGTIENVSDIPYAVWCCPYANVRWFARRIDGGPILAQKEWTKDFPSSTRDSNAPFGLRRGESRIYGSGPPKWMMNLPAGRYQVWMLYREFANNENPLSEHPLILNPEDEGLRWRSPAMQLVSNAVAIDLP